MVNFWAFQFILLDPEFHPPYRSDDALLTTDQFFAVAFAA